MNFFINTKKKKQGAEMGRFRSGVRDQGARQLILNGLGVGLGIRGQDN